MEPGKTGVMEPVLAQDISNREDTVYQVKWDGVRMLVFIGEGQVILQNRRGRIKTASFPELSCLGSLSHQPMILDGEVVVIKDGKPDFALLLGRNFTSQPRASAPPVSYIVFDILQWQGKDLRQESLARRQEILAEVGLPLGPASAIDNFTDGVRLMTLTRERAWEGIVAKNVLSPYVAGKSTSWRKYKNSQRDIFTVVGYLNKEGQLASLLIAKDFGDGLRLTGSVGSGLNSVSRKMLTEIAPLLVQDQPSVPIRGRIKGAQWLRPLIQADIVFMEWTDTLTLRAPVIKALVLEGKSYELS